MDQSEMMDLANVPIGTPTKIGEHVYYFGSSIIPLATLDELRAVVQKNPISINIIFNPELKRVPEYTTLLENYIQQYLCRTVKVNAVNTTTRTFTDADLQAIAARCTNNNTESVYQELLILRKKNEVNAELQERQAEFDVLDRKLRMNTLTPEERVRGEELYGTIIPNLKQQLADVTTELSEYISKRDAALSASEPVTSSEVQKSVIADTNQTLSSDVTDTDTNADAENTVSTEVTNSLVAKYEHPVKQSSIKSCTQITAKWNDVRLKRMPLHVAKQFAMDTAYQQYRKQQVDVDGYTAVPLEYLIMYGITLYPDNVPIVFTSAGEFMRIGTSDHKETDMSYWYPKPSYLK